LYARSPEAKSAANTEGISKGWFSAFRIYGPQAPTFDGTWKLNDIEKVK
jgi:hypothetical protein